MQRFAFSAIALLALFACGKKQDSAQTAPPLSQPPAPQTAAREPTPPRAPTAAPAPAEPAPASPAPPSDSAAMEEKGKPDTSKHKMDRMEEKAAPDSIKRKADKMEDSATSDAGKAKADGNAAPDSSKHKVAKGETLFSIAKKHGVKSADLAKWNNIRDPSRIRVGQELALSAP